MKLKPMTLMWWVFPFINLKWKTGKRFRKRDQGYYNWLQREYVVDPPPPPSEYTKFSLDEAINVIEQDVQAVWIFQIICFF